MMKRSLRTISAKTYNQIIKRCFFVGPPVGLLVLLPFLASISGGDWSMSPLPFFVIVGPFLCYFFGGLQAAFGGFLMAEYASRTNTLPLLIALCIGAVCALCSAFYFSGMFRDIDNVWGLVSFFLAVHIIPAVVCWLLCRKLVEREPDDPHHP